MTTILADARRGIVVADTSFNDGDRVWRHEKVRRISGALVACAGSAPQFHAFFDWYQGGMAEDPQFPFDAATALILDRSGLWLFEDEHTRPVKVKGGIEAIGSGAKAAICAYEALGNKDPARAVRIVCKHDAGSRAPVITYKLKES
jgi:ATP-dependent protease HslVU (ClpYQ) peptidase subunit